MLRAISLVAVPCSSTAAAIAVVTSLISRIVLLMFRMAPTAEVVTSCMLAMSNGFPRLHSRSGWRGSCFGCHHGKSPAGFAGARGFDGGVERQQIGLRSDRLNQIDDDADAARVLREALHGRIGRAGLIDGLARDLRRTHDLASDFGNRGRQLLGARRYGLNVD